MTVRVGTHLCLFLCFRLSKEQSLRSFYKEVGLCSDLGRVKFLLC